MSRNKRSVDQRKFLEDLSSLWPLAKGSLTEVRKPCIRSNCPACRQGRKHRAFLFSFTRHGRRRCRYVPRNLAPILRKALLHGRRLDRRLSELGEELIQRHRLMRNLTIP